MADDGTTESYVYDDSGRVTAITRDGLTTWYRYDGLGRLRSVENSVGMIRAFDRDADGAIVRRWGGAEPEAFEVDGWSHVSGAPAKEQWTPVLSREGTQLQFHLVEFDGTDIITARPTGQVLGFRRLQAYGQPFMQDGEPDLQRGFHSHREEAGLDLTAAGPRHLLRADGRWLQPEPLLYIGIPGALLSDPRSMLMYRYGHNAPSTHADPSGYSAHDTPARPDDEITVRGGKIHREPKKAKDEESEGSVVWPDELAGTTHAATVMKETNPGQGATTAAQKEERNAASAHATNSVLLAAKLIVIGRVLAIYRKIVASRGVLSGGKFAQKTYGEMFSAGGKFAGQSVDDVADALKRGTLSVDDVPIDYIVRDGNTLMLNTRSAMALERAGIPRSQWNAVDRTGSELYEALLDGQLSRNKLTSEGIETVRSSGR